MDYFRKFMCIPSGPPRRFDQFPKTDHLSQIPELVMMKILEKCDFSEIENLRKTCKTFRNFIDTSKPDLKIFRIQITAKKDSLVLFFMSKNSKKFQFEYQKGNRIVNHYSNPQKSRKISMDYCNSFFKDLQYLLDHQKSRIFHFEVDFEFETNAESFEFSKKLEAVLASRHRPLAVKFLRITVFDEEDVVGILKHLEPGSLEILHILNAKKEEPSRNMIFEKIRELEQFKKAREFETRLFLGAEPIRNFCHFERVDITVQGIQVEDVVFVKEAFLTSPIPKIFRIGFYGFPNRNQLLLSLGRSEEPNKWYFPMTENGQGLQISLHAYSLTFTRIPELKFAIENLNKFQKC